MRVAASGRVSHGGAPGSAGSCANFLARRARAVITHHLTSRLLAGCGTDPRIQPRPRKRVRRGMRDRPGRKPDRLRPSNPELAGSRPKPSRSTAGAVVVAAVRGRGFTVPGRVSMEKLL